MTRPRKIDVPTLGCTTWQDDEVGSRAAWTMFPKLDPARTWMVGTNGFHGQCVFSTAMTKELAALLRPVRQGRAQRLRADPAHADLARRDRCRRTPSPGGSPPAASWPPATSASRLYLGKDAALTAAPPAGDEPADDYVSPTVSAGTENGIAFGQSGQLWKTAGRLPRARRPTRRPSSAHDVELLGPASVEPLAEVHGHGHRPAGHDHRGPARRPGGLREPRLARRLPAQARRAGEHGDHARADPPRVRRRAARAGRADAGAGRGVPVRARLPRRIADPR